MTSRDLAILRFTFEQRVVSHKQISKRFFGTAKTSTVQFRLDALTRAGYLSKSVTLFGGVRTIIYSATHEAIRAISPNYGHEITKVNVKSDSVQHDLGLVNVRERLEKTKMMTTYLSENMLQSCGSLVESEEFKAFSLLNSDAALEINTPKRSFRVALEYEASEKQEARYCKKLTDYYFAPNIAAVFYVCGSDRIERLIRKVDQDIGEKFDPKIFTCSEKTFHQEIGPLPFTNRKKATFLLE